MMEKNLGGSPVAALAPMAGVSDHIMRMLCARQGVSFSVTEMVNAQGYCCAPENQRAIERLLFKTEAEGTVGVQLFGREPIYFARAAERLQSRGFAFVDINMGCPARKVVSGGSGSALMLEPRLCGEIVRAVKGAVSCPVTVKMRAGWDEGSKNAVEIAKICEQNGADMLTIHGRTREQQYSGLADRGIMRDVATAVAIPVLANGDIASAQDARECIAQTGCAGVAIGRAARGNPWLFAEIAKGVDAPASADVRIRGAIEHLRLLCQSEGEHFGVVEARKHIAWYLHGLRGATVVRLEIMSMQRQAQVEERLLAFLETF